MEDGDKIVKVYPSYNSVRLPEDGDYIFGEEAEKVRKELNKKINKYINSKVAANIISDYFLKYGYNNMFAKMKYTNFEDPDEREMLKNYVSQMHHIFDEALKELGG